MAGGKALPGSPGGAVFDYTGGMKLYTVYLGLGSNLGDRERNLRQAASLLGRRGIPVRRLSGLYETAPVGITDQPWFLNAVAEARTGLPPRLVLEACLAVERDLGRDRTSPQFRPGGPRTLDLDLLFYGSERVHEDGLEVPHPRLHERRFVLVPLAEIAPDLVHPGLGRAVRDLLETCPDRSDLRPFRP
jgi:2-amino-4-hydroxy-6-hydroxymethyldihydropteridine diphosphokinase